MNVKVELHLAVGRRVGHDSSHTLSFINDLGPYLRLLTSMPSSTPLDQAISTP